MFTENANKTAERQVIRIAGSQYQDLIALIQWVYLGFFKVTEVNGNIVNIAEGLNIDLGIKVKEEKVVDVEDDDNTEDPGEANKQAPTVFYEDQVMLVNDDGTAVAVPVNSIVFSEKNILVSESIGPPSMDPVICVQKKEPNTVKVQKPDVAVQVLEKSDNKNIIMDSKNNVKKVLGQPGSVGVKVVYEDTDSDTKNDLVAGKEVLTKKDEAKCPVCQKRFHNKIYMLSHYKKEHSKNGKRFACIKSKCNFQAPYNEQIMTAHMKMHELNKNSQQKDAKSNQIAVRNYITTRNPSARERETFHACDICNLRFRSHDYLRIHNATKHYETKYMCPSCNYEAKSKKALGVHIDLSHCFASKKPIQMTEDEDKEDEDKEDGEVDIRDVKSQPVKMIRDMNFLKH